LNDCGFKEMIDNLEVENPTLYDPAMGSGGLLGFTYTTCKDKIKPNDIYGCEIEKDTMRYGESSILITTKLFNNNLIRCNTLDRNTNPYLRDNKKFNIIVSNPPFGTQTNYKDLIPDEYRDDKKYKDEIYPISTSGEKLFIQNIIYLLADGGICALILPDGELMTKNDTNKTIRKFILDNCKIIKIIEVENGVFKHTNIKTKVLILKKQKQDNYDYQIDYMNINKKCQTTLIKKLILNDDYQFTIKTNDYNDIFSDNPDIEIKTLGEVCEFQNGKRIVKSQVDTGEYPVLGGGGFTSFYTNEYSRDGKSCKISREGMSLHNCVMILNQKYYLNSQAFTIISNNDKLIDNYLWYYLDSIKEIIYNCGRGVAQKSIDIDEFNKIKIPIPSLEQQEEVIKTIEDINELIDYRKTLKENQTKEKKYLLDDIKRRYLRNQSNYEFGKLFDLIKGSIQSSKVVEDPEGITLVTGAKEFKKIKVISNISIISGHNLFISTNGNGDKIPIKYYDKECYYSCLMSLCKIKDEFKERINIKFIYYLLLQNQSYIEINFQKGLANKSLDVEEFNKIKIPIPSLEHQTEFIREVEELNMTYDKLEKDNNNIIEQLENIKKDTFKF
jgi:type I restriction enzyme S subunit